MDGVEAAKEEGKDIKRKEEERDDGREARSQKLEAGNSTKKGSGHVSWAKCVRACNVGTINDGIACVTSRTSAGRSSSAPPLENSGGTRRVVYLRHACVHRLHRCTHVPCRGLRVVGAWFTKCLPRLVRAAPSPRENQRRSPNYSKQLRNKRRVTRNLLLCSLTL